MNPQDKANIEKLKSLQLGENTRNGFHIRYATLRDIGVAPDQAWNKIVELIEKAKADGRDLQQ